VKKYKNTAKGARCAGMILINFVKTETFVVSKMSAIWQRRRDDETD